MEIALFIIGFIIVFFVVINVFRKLHMDAIHYNLLDLADEIGGEVLKRGMLSRPVYHGDLNGMDLTVNFSTERVQKKRRQFINISIARVLQNNLTIATRQWLENTAGSAPEEFDILEIDSDTEYLIRKSSKKSYLRKNGQDEFSECLKKLSPFNYIYGGPTGILFEQECENLATCTKHPQLKENIDHLYRLAKVLV
ncbi:MAG: hypothetical protein E4H13_05490 [Calditrichales bacterium]|nr:MAG: hypothetical protein E4H13_05490 [Calditrichales bacterium]